LERRSVRGNKDFGGGVDRLKVGGEIGRDNKNVVARAVTISSKPTVT
jgi:hypothetical protein